MAQVNLPEEALRRMLKDALAEALEERRDLLRDVMTEVLEDLALTEAIREGQHTKFADRDDVMALLGGSP